MPILLNVKLPIWMHLQGTTDHDCAMTLNLDSAIEDQPGGHSKGTDKEIDSQFDLQCGDSEESPRAPLFVAGTSFRYTNTQFAAKRCPTRDCVL